MLSNSIIIDVPTNTYETCYQSCETCSEIGTSITDQKYDTCRALTYKEHRTSNCIPSCTNHYYQDEINRLCVN